MDKTAVDLGWGRRNVSGLEAKLGVLSWLAPMVVISLLVAHDPQRRTVTPLYHAAAAAWGAGKDLYQGPGGMNYLPQFAVIFYPFHWLPAPLGDILWRWLEAALLASGVWSLCQDLSGNPMGGAGMDKSLSIFPASRSFFYASLLVMPLCLAALRNGQANAMLAGLALCAAASIARRRWWAAAVLIAFLVGVKPLGIVMLLLAATAYGPLRFRLAATLAALFLLPFVFAPSGYVAGQFHGFFENIGKCALVHEDRFADIGGIVRTFGLELPRRLSVIARFAAGPLFLVLWLTGARRLREPLRAMWLLALAASYLMLFNPMNEANGYAILAPALGLWAVAALKNPATRRFGWMSVSICLSMSILPNLLHPVFGNYFALFWHPVMTILFIASLAGLVLRKEKAWSGGKTDSGCEGLEQTSSGSYV
ncbi:MAG: glycosyltransferase family 87 protein [Syntrophobacteraceae bacterium]|nr:glycosyltransferase family 87 protein [Syntrophobacteraceae bacterium]